MKKILAIVLSLCMVFAMVPVAALAAEENTDKALTGVGIEFNESIAPVAEDWTLAGSNSKITAENGIYLDNGNSNSYINATYNDTFNLTNGFTVTYKANARYYKNYAMGNAYKSVVIGNVSAGIEVADSAKTAAVLKIRVNNTVVATSDVVFDSNSEGWNAASGSADNIGTFIGNPMVLTLDYDVETKTVTYSTPDASVSYVDEANAIDVSDAAVILRSHASWSGFATFSQFKLEGKAASLKATYIYPGKFDLTGINTTDWTLNGTTGSITDSSNTLNAPSSSTGYAKATSNATYTVYDEFETSFNYVLGNYNNYYGDARIDFGTNRIAVGNIGAQNDGVFHAYVKTSAGTVATALIGTKDKTAINGVYVFNYKDGMLSATVDGVALQWTVDDGTAEAVAVTFDEAVDVPFIVSVGGNYGPGKYINNFYWNQPGKTVSMQQIEDAMASLANASLETYADAAATIDALMPMLTQDHLDMLTSLSVYEKYKADYAAYAEYKEADAAIIAKNVTYKLIDGMYESDWTDISLGGGMFIRGTKAINDTTNVTINPAGFYANNRSHHTMTSKYALNTADYFKITEKHSVTDYQDTYLKWTIGDLAIGIYDDGNNTSPDGDTGFNGGKKMTVFQIFYKGELVKAITGEANNYGLDKSVDGCSTWMFANCEFTITYDHGNLMITFYNGATKYVTAKTGFDLTAIEGFDYNPNGNHVNLDIYTSYSNLKLTKATITGKMNKAAVDAFDTLAATDVNAAKNIYGTVSDDSVISDAAKAAIAGEFAVSAEEGLTYTAVVDGYNTDAYRYGDSVTFTAEGNVGGWYDAEGNLLSEEAAYTCTITPGVSIIAKVGEAVCEHTATTETKENVVDADCDTAGSYEKVITCDDCGEEISRETVTVDALGHTAGDAVVENNVAADCDTAGSYDNVTYCTVCGEEISRETVTVDALGHKYDAVVTDPDCENGGYTTHTCSVCGDNYVDNYTDALGHTEVVDEAVAPTLNSTGLTEGKHCSVCGKVLVAQTVIDKLVGEATINGYNYATIEEAVAAANDGDVIVINKDVTVEKTMVITKAITIDGDNNTLTFTGKGDVRAINVDVNGNVTIADLAIKAEGAARAINVINKPATVILNNVDIVAGNYAVNVAASAAGASVTVNDSDLVGLNVVNIRANNVDVEINNTKLTVNDNTASESYAAVAIGSEMVNGSVVMNGGEIVANGDSIASSTWTDVVADFNGTVGAEKNYAVVATTEGGAGYYSLQEAIDHVAAGATITLVRDINLDKAVKIAKKITIDLNGNNINADFTSAYGALYVAMAGDLTIVGEGAINSTDIAIGVYGNLTVNGGTISGDYAAIYNFYYDANTYGKATVNGTVNGWVLNCGELAVEGGSVQWIDNSGALAVNGGAVEYVYGRDGSDAAGVEGAGTIAIADPSAIEVPEGYVLLEVDGVYKVHAHEYKAVVTDPDCVNGGYTTHTCETCGDTYVDNYTDALGHAWSEWEITTTATATTPGVKTRTCGTCGEVETQEYTLTTEGTAGDITWRFEDGTLYFEGTGAMADYDNVGNIPPWREIYRDVTAVVIGDGITHIGNRAFRGFNRLLTVTFGKDVETIGYEAFYVCNKLTTVTLNEGLTDIGSLAFYGCTALAEIEIPSTVATLNNRAFKGAGLVSVVVPDSVTYTGYEVFMDCANLETVVYSRGVHFINSRVFENCASLKAFTVTANIERIRTKAFYGCTALESITFEDAANMWPTSDGLQAKIASDTFAGCNASLKMIADDDTHVEDYADKNGFVFEAK